MAHRTGSTAAPLRARGQQQVAKGLLTRPSSRHAARLSMTVTTRPALTGDATCCMPPLSDVSTSPNHWLPGNPQHYGVSRE